MIPCEAVNGDGDFGENREMDYSLLVESNNEGGSMVSTGQYRYILTASGLTSDHQSMRKKLDAFIHSAESVFRNEVSLLKEHYRSSVRDAWIIGICEWE